MCQPLINLITYERYYKEIFDPGHGTIMLESEGNIDKRENEIINN